MLLQRNHARVLEPKGLDSIFANNTNRLWPKMRVIDATRAMEIRVRKKAAPSILGAPDAATFAGWMERSVLSFPLFCSIKITMRKDT